MAMFHPPKPDGAQTVSNWFITSDTGRPVVKRMVTYPDKPESAQRYPRKFYKNLTPDELEKFVYRLNGRNIKAESAEAEAIFRHAYVSPDLWGDYETQIHAEVPNEKDARHQLKVVQTEFLNYFIVTQNLKDPIEWKLKETKWGEWLIAKGLSAKSIRHRVQWANRFMRFLYERYPRELNLVIFKPLSKSRLKQISAQRKIDEDDESTGQFIPAADWRKIRKALPKKIRPFVLLAYYYGLRRSEALAVQLADIKVDHLHVQRKLVKSSQGEYLYGPLKDREDRNTEHWFIWPRLTYEIVASIDARMHPDTFYEYWTEFMRDMKMSYALHDLRRTFVTRALNKHPPNDVRLAVGHASLATTMRYAMDDRQLDNRVFTPKRNSA